MMLIMMHVGPREKPEMALPLQATFVSMNELLAESDIVSVHCPLNAATTHLFNAKT